MSLTRWDGRRTRRCVEHCYSISTRKLARGAALPVGGLGLWVWPEQGVFVMYELHADLRLTLDYSWRGQEFAQVVTLAETRPHYGGSRWWFACPRCSRRVRDLHLPGYSCGPFRCRHCHALSYASAQCTRSGVAWGLAERMAQAVGGTHAQGRKLLLQHIGGYSHTPKLLDERLIVATDGGAQ